MDSFQDFVVDAFKGGCNSFKMTTHITPGGHIRVHFEGKGDNPPEADGLIHNDSITIIENVKIC